MRAWLAVLLLGCAPPAPGEPIAVRATAVALDAHTPHTTRVGRLRYRGGLHLTAASRLFGGLSGVHVGADGAELVAVSDEGHWLRARLMYDAAGDLVDVARAEMGPLRDSHGAVLQGKTEQDAEELTRLGDGSWLVSFERHHRIWRYAAGAAPSGAAEPLTLSHELARAPANGGLEALTVLGDGRLFALCEELEVRGGVRGFVREGRRWHRLTYALDGLPRPAGAALLPTGDLLVLERSYTPRTGLLVRLRRIAARRVRKNARLEGEIVAQLRLPLTIDNFEGLAARRGPAGETLIYLLSDDNFSPDQRTLLLMFALDETRPPR